MSIQIADPSNNTLKSIRTLIVGDKERYRLEINNQLVYAKGKVVFDLNKEYKDSNGEIQEIDEQISGDHFDFWWNIYVKGNYSYSYSSHDYDWPLFAFWEEGLFWKKTDQWFLMSEIGEDFSNFVLKYREECPWLPQKIKDSYKCRFLGWYTEKTGGKGPIRNLNDLKRYTDLFDRKKEDTLPEVILYAHWKIPTYKLRIHNINKKGAESSFTYYDLEEKRDKTLKGGTLTCNIKYQTNIKKYIKNTLKIKNEKYISWAASRAKDLLSNENDIKKLKSSRAFIEWIHNTNHHDEKKNQGTIIWQVWDIWDLGKTKNPSSDAMRGTSFYLDFAIKSDEDLYPCFESIVIYPKNKKLPNGKSFGGKLVCIYKDPINGLSPVELGDYGNYYHSYYSKDGKIHDTGFAPIYYGEAYLVINKNGKKRYYKWRVSETDVPRKSRSRWESDDIITSSTTIEKLVEVT